MPQSKEISLSEVKRHNSESSCWMVIHDNVYDVTKFLAEHPGGADSLLDYAGKDGTEAFEDVGHSDDAKALMKQYKVGKLPDYEKTPSSSTSNVKSASSKTKKQSYQPLRIESGTCCNARCNSEFDKPWRSFDDDESRSQPVPHIPCQAKAKQMAKARRRLLQCQPKQARPNVKSKSHPKKHPSHQQPTKQATTNKIRHKRMSSLSGSRACPARNAGGSGSTLKWAVLALAAALVAGFVLKKALAS